MYSYYENALDIKFIRKMTFVRYEYAPKIKKQN